MNMSISRNDPCSCGSGKKYKKCCLAQDEEKNSPDYLLENARQFPIEVCMVREDWQEDGLANFLIVRKNPEDQTFLYAMFLVDTFCLGIKNVLFDTHSIWNVIQALINIHPYDMVEVDYEYARGIILGAKDFAKNFGFEPNEDFKKVKGMVEVDRPYETRYTFGKKGKPFYIQGPDDDVEAILKILEKNCPSSKKTYENEI